ncbi:ATP-dependent DNA helicase RecG [Paramicrobacterium agarici]|uniref:ATP-dependent DNA helicase RecG n=1 Tax=Paramicrobacterium agarici TaxID=630514 RepID=UPI00114D522D|nr:ATP-dependent DNA helicase RecG [Microbacterium agarici]TQO21432.1 ATP-dependent DNA helicase RecG [Microbacterium agarici]
MNESGLDGRLSGPLGGRTAGALERVFGHRSIGDLLAHYPRRYAHHGELTQLGGLPVGENVALVADVVRASVRPMNKRKGTIFEAVISDGRGILTLTFFNQTWRKEELVPGARGVFSGKISSYRGSMQLTHPDYKLFEKSGMSDDDARVWATTPIPIYAATSSIQTWTIEKSIAVVLDYLTTFGVYDPVPAAIRESEGLLEYATALERIHRPRNDDDWKHARRTLRFHEAFVLQAALIESRAQAREQMAMARVAEPGGPLDRFDAQLPFSLTGDQTAVGEAITADLVQRNPMNRLVQGEVGSGKTLVALRAMLTVAQDGGQTALLAPTEVLAAQHMRSIVAALGPDLAADMAPVLLTGRMPAADRKRALLRIVGGQAKIVVGTHALLSDVVEFYDLGLIVIDEQHRFGVDQRDTLRRKSAAHPHTLVLTATPIPRTVAMTVFGDLDVSTITELPVGRKGIETFVVPLAVKPTWMPRVWARMREEIDLGRQAFVVCPAIDSDRDGEPGDESVSEADGDAGRPIATVFDTASSLRAEPSLHGLTIEILHGRMTTDEKDDIMLRFAAGDIDVLVTTTVIEVGVDVPNASTMIVLDADRFGVSQLHQLRGRVGRGSVPGLCLLVTNAAPETTSLERVEAVASTTDGFELAQRDLELRREGDVLGGAQSGGRSSLRLLRVATDGDVIMRAREAAEALHADDPGFTRHPALREAIDRRLDETEREAMSKS